MPSLAPKEKAFVIKMIQTHLPRAKIIAFGSRIRGDAKKYSDLDIAIDNSQTLTLRERDILGEVFAESDLPYKVDLVDLNQVDDDFAALIRKTGEGWA